jgi:hypothetical protein
MALPELVETWHREGKLDTEFARLERILTLKQFTRTQIEGCFGTMIISIAMLSADHETRALPFEVFKQELNRVLSDEVRTVEVCAELAEELDKSEREIVQGIQRHAKNILWQRGANEEE